MDTQQEPVLQVLDLHKRFGALEVLRGIDLEARKGDVIAIIGSSGSGKSALLRCINLLEVPERGTLRIAGEQIVMKRRGGRRMPASGRQITRVRSRLGMVFQSFNLWAHMTVMGNVMEGPVQVLGLSRPQARQRAEALLAKVGVADKADCYPAQLSGGQQQRVAIARALAMEPDVLLFDEPTSALDPELVAEVLRVIRALADEGRTMLIVTHEIGFARQVANRMIFLHQGRIEEDGPPEQVCSRPSSARCRAFLSQCLESIEAR